MAANNETLKFMRVLWGLVHGLDVRSKWMERNLGVTGPQRLVVRMVGRQPGIAASEIAVALDLHPSTLTGILSRLEKRGYLTRDLFSFVRARSSGSAASTAELVPTGALPACLPLLSAHDISLPPAMAVAARAAGHAL